MIGTSFLRVAAHDDDFGTNAAITYSISSEQPEYLWVNPLTGWVYVNQPISQVNPCCFHADPEGCGSIVLRNHSVPCMSVSRNVYPSEIYIRVHLHLTDAVVPSLANLTVGCCLRGSYMVVLLWVFKACLQMTQDMEIIHHKPFV